GYQLITAIALAYLLKLNKPIVIVAANISIAPMMPVIIYLSYITGGIFLGNKSGGVLSVSDTTFDFVKNNIIQYVAGSIIFGLILSVTLGLLVFLLLKFFRKTGKK
ncbi:MAG: DUF2062 domain-containing protein, partial [Bacteroidales bacterium]|nr:DUF2062 domain-containing protein [Bacteroidales bacterium]